jgi:putative transposase
MEKPPKQTTAHERNKPAQGVLYISGQPTIVFVTVSTINRRPWLADSKHHETLIDIWRDDATAWLVGRYVLMPDHMHFFAGLANEKFKFETWMRYWKRRFCQVSGLPPGSLQSGEWDTRMRGPRVYAAKWEYVRNNPVRHGLVERAEDWPYAGEVHGLTW